MCTTIIVLCPHNMTQINADIDARNIKNGYVNVHYVIERDDGEITSSDFFQVSSIGRARRELQVVRRDNGARKVVAKVERY